MIAFDVAEHEIHNVFLCGSENFDIFGGTIIFSIWSTNTDKSMSFRVTNLFFFPQVSKYISTSMLFPGLALIGIRMDKTAFNVFYPCS